MDAYKGGSRETATRNPWLVDQPARRAGIPVQPVYNGCIDAAKGYINTSVPKGRERELGIINAGYLTVA